MALSYFDVEWCYLYRRKERKETFPRHLVGIEMEEDFDK